MAGPTQNGPGVVLVLDLDEDDSDYQKIDLNKKSKIKKHPYDCKTTTLVYERGLYPTIPWRYSHEIFTNLNTINKKTTRAGQGRYAGASGSGP